MHQFSRRARWSLIALTPLMAALAVAPATASVIISTGKTTNMRCVANVCSPTAANAVLGARKLQKLLASANVTVKSGSGALDIVVAAPLTWTSGVTLTLDAFRILSVSRPISVTGTGGLTILTNDGGTGGVFLIGGPGHVTFASLSSPLTINGHSYILANSIQSLSGAIGGGGGAYVALASSYDAKPDGVYSSSPINMLFGGALDALGNTIRNLKIAVKGNRAGFFEAISDGSVQHLNLSNISVRGGGDAGIGGLAS